MSNNKEPLILQLDDVTKEKFFQNANDCTETIMRIFESYCKVHNINPLPLGMVVFDGLAKSFHAMLLSDAEQRGIISHHTKTYDA